MALPANTLSSLPVKADFLLPDATGRKSRVEDFERGGIALNDASQGLDVQDWRVRVVGTTIRIGAYPNGPETDLFLAAGVTEVSLAFDQLMRPAVAYVQSGVAKLYWYDTSIAAQSTLTIGAVRTPFLCLDDKRVTQTSTSDILLFYLAGTELRYRQQRDRFQIERTLATGIDGAAYINRCGMGTNLRLHIEIANAGKLQPRRGFMILRDEGADLFAGLGFRGVNGTLTAVETGTDSFEASGLLLSNAGTANWIEAGVDVFAAAGSLGAAAGDPYYNNVSLLLHADGSNGSTTFVDSSPNQLAVTAYGTASITTAEAKFGTGGFYTGGTSGTGFLRVGQTPLTIFGTSDFTIEGWFKPLGSGNERTVFIHGINTGGGLTVFVGTGGVRFRSNGVTDLAVAMSISSSAFTHVAFVRSGNTRLIFVAGVQVASDTLSFNVSDNVVTDIGASDQNSGDQFRYYGYIDDFRITKGVARYTANFTPPTTAFPDVGNTVADPYFAGVTLLLHADGANNSTTFVDSSASARTVTAVGDAKISTAQSRFGGSSALFDGNGDYLSVNVPGGLGAGAFTLEFWVYPNATTGYLFNNRSSGGFGADGIDIRRDGYITTSGIGLTNATGTMTVGQWNHVAVVRDIASNFKLYVGGTFVSGSSNNYAFTGSSFTIGGSPGGNVGWLDGYIDELRLTSGAARYTANFTPPGAPFQDTGDLGVDPYYSNVSLLLHADGANGSTTFTDNSPSPKTVTSNGNTLAEVSTSVVKYGTGSCNFKSSNNYLRANAIASEFNFGTGDFTVEFWANWSTVGDSGFVSGDENGSFDFAYVAGTLRIGRINTAWDTNVTWITPTAGVWYHIVYSRSGTNVRIFVNGMQVTPTASNSTSYTANLVNVGISRAVSNDRPFNGYIDDLRITKGVARYTDNFTPPTAAFPNASPAAPTARYWRLKNFAVANQYFEITEIQFFAGGNRVDVSMSSSNAPSFNAVSALNDQNLTTRCYWDSGAVPFANLWIAGDCGIPVAVDSIKMAGETVATRYPSGFQVEYSNDNVNWTLKATITGLSYPGNYTLSSSINI